MYQGPCHALLTRKCHIFITYNRGLQPYAQRASTVTPLRHKQPLDAAQRTTVTRITVGITRQLPSAEKTAWRRISASGKPDGYGVEAQPRREDALLSFNHEIPSDFSAWTERLERFSVEFRFHAAGVPQRQDELILSLPVSLFSRTQ